MDWIESNDLRMSDCSGDNIIGNNLLHYNCCTKYILLLLTLFVGGGEDLLHARQRNIMVASQTHQTFSATKQLLSTVTF